MSRAFITGVRGQDGTLLARNLLERGVEVWGMERDASKGQGRRPKALRGVRLVEGDLVDRERMRALVGQIQPDQIYNLAGISSVGFSWDNPGLTGEVTGVGAVNVFEAALELQEASGKRVRVVHASSAEIFGSPPTSPQSEETAIAPVSPYGAAKAYAHRMAQVFRSRGLQVSNLILFAHESPLRPPSFVTRKITQGAARIAQEGGTLRLGNLAAKRDWGYAGDYVEAMRLAAETGEAGDYVVATGESHSVADFVATAFTHAGVESWEDHVEVDPRFFRPVDPVELTGDATKAREVLGWTPQVSFEGLVEMMVDADVEELAKERC